MSSGLNELKRIAREILDPGKEPADLIPAAQALRDLFENRTHFCVDHDRDIAVGGTRLDSGLAISPTLAAMCIRELFRTLSFIRGLNQAISDAMRPGRPVRILYAGCGPYASLAVPLMAVYSPGQLAFTLLDIHRESLDRALTLITSFGLGGHVEDALCEDATRYRIPEEKQPDVIVSETMAVCLHNEPQVTIARHLLGQAPEARMVPQSVSIEVCMLDWAREHVLMPAGYIGEFPQSERDRVYLGRIFELDAASILGWQDLEGDHLPGGSVRIPISLKSHYRPYLLTKILVYGDIRLQDYDCSLTLPQHLPGRPRFAGGEILHFYYKLGPYPELGYEIAG